MRNRTLLIGGLIALVLGLVGLAVGPGGGPSRWWSGDWFWGHHGWMMGAPTQGHDEPAPDPISGAETVRTALTDYRDSIQFLWDQAVRHINRGALSADLGILGIQDLVTTISLDCD